MDINKKLDSLESLSKDEIVHQALVCTEAIITAMDELVESSDGQLTRESLVNTSLKYFIITLCGADGRIDSSEHELMEKIFDYADIDTLDLDGARAALQLINSNDLENQSYSVVMSAAKAYDNNMGSSVSDAVIELAACIFVYNGTVDSAEMKVLNLLVKLGEISLDDSDDISNSGDISDSGSNNSNSVGVESDSKLEVVKHDATMASDDGTYYLSIGAEIKNPNPSRIAQSVNIKIIVKDSSGRIIETSDKYIEHIDSNSTFFFGNEISIYDGVPASYIIQVNCDEFVDGPNSSDFAKGIECSHYNVSKDRWGDTTFSGNVHNNYNQTLNVELFFVFYDDSGNIVGGCSYYVGSIYGNSDDGISTTLHTYANRSKVSSSAAFSFYDVV